MCWLFYTYFYPVNIRYKFWFAPRLFNDVQASLSRNVQYCAQFLCSSQHQPTQHWEWFIFLCHRVFSEKENIYDTVEDHI
jgi:hypothetical protein